MREIDSNIKNKPVKAAMAKEFGLHEQKEAK